MQRVRVPRMALHEDLEIDRRDIHHGRTVVVQFGKPEEVLRWESRYNEPFPLSLTVFQRLLGAPPAGTLIPPLDANNLTAEVRLNLLWGSGGTQAQAFVDLDRSTTFAIACSWFSLNAIYLGFGGAAPPLPDVEVGCNGSEACRSVPLPRLTERVFALDVGIANAQLVAVPPFAYSVRPLAPFPAGAGNVRVDQLDAVGTLLNSHTYGDTEPDEFELLHNAARVIRYTNLTPAIMPVAALLFEIAL